MAEATNFRLTADYASIISLIFFFIYLLLGDGIRSFRNSIINIARGKISEDYI